MDAPASFRSSLARQFDGQLRVRWSEARQEWQIEQKMRRARLSSRRIHEGTIQADDLIRSRDGYAFVLAVKPGNVTPCPRCHAPQRIPELRMHRTTCPRCRHSFLAVYYPLSDLLLEHLRYTDPYRGGLDRIIADQDRASTTVAETHRRDSRREGDAFWRDHFNQLARVRPIGYTGRERPYEH